MLESGGTGKRWQREGKGNHQIRKATEATKGQLKDTRGTEFEASAAAPVHSSSDSFAVCILPSQSATSRSCSNLTLTHRHQIASVV